VFNTAIHIFDGYLAAHEYGCFLPGDNTSRAAVISGITRKKPAGFELVYMRSDLPALKILSGKELEVRMFTTTITYEVN
jgi:hypothetical protein